MKQKVFSWNEKFTVKNEAEEDVFFVEGSLMKIPKTFSIYNQVNEEVAKVIKKSWSFLPIFYVEVGGEVILTIKKEFTFFKAKYTLDMSGWEMIGDWWDMDFELIRHDQVVGKVRKEWFNWGDTYEIAIMDDEYLEKVMIALVVAIDYVKASQAATINSTT